jgi:hypothetical protein
VVLLFLKKTNRFVRFHRRILSDEPASNRGRTSFIPADSLLFWFPVFFLRGTLDTTWNIPSGEKDGCHGQGGRRWIAP